MSNNASSCAKNITDEILKNIQDEHLMSTSGTLIELVNIGLHKLSGLWTMPEYEDEYDVKRNYSTKILRDYIEISSTLYHQLFAWDEMEAELKTNMAFDLMQTNEIIGFRHLDAMEYESGLEEEDMPYVDNTIRDSRNMIHIYVAAVNKTKDIHIPNVQIPLQSLENNGRMWRVFSANYSFHNFSVPGDSSLG